MPARRPLRPAPRVEPTPPLLGLALAFVAGFVDTLGFVALAGLFTAHVTGNFVLIGAAWAQPAGGSVLHKLLAFPAFIVAVAFAHLLARRLGRQGRSPLRRLLALQATLLTGFGIVGHVAVPLAADGNAAAWAGMLGAAAMGLQNAQGRSGLAGFVPTTVMTGNVTQLVTLALDRWAGAPSAAPPGRLRELAGATVAFALGAMAGGFGFVHAGFAALAVPVALTGALALRPPRPLSKAVS